MTWAGNSIDTSLHRRCMSEGDTVFVDTLKDMAPWEAHRIPCDDARELDCFTQFGDERLLDLHSGLWASKTFKT